MDESTVHQPTGAPAVSTAGLAKVFVSCSSCRPPATSPRSLASAGRPPDQAACNAVAPKPTARLALHILGEWIKMLFYTCTNM